jgi:hypothetical protein
MRRAECAGWKGGEARAGTSCNTQRARARRERFGMGKSPLNTEEKSEAGMWSRFKDLAFWASERSWYLIESKRRGWKRVSCFLSAT